MLELVLNGLIKLEKENGALGVLVGIMFSLVSILFSLMAFSWVSFIGISKFYSWIELVFFGVVR